MLSPKKLRSIRNLRRRREQAAVAQHAKCLRTLAELDLRRAEIEGTIASLEQSRTDLFTSLHGSITRADLYALKRQESYLAHQLVEACANAHALETERRDAELTENTARQRVGETHRRLEKIEHVQRKETVRQKQKQSVLEDIEAEEHIQ